MTPKVESKFRMELKRALAEKNLSIEELAMKCETGYENIRKIVNKSAFPSKHILPKICNVLGLNLTQMDKLLIEDRARAKGWTSVIKEAAGIDSRIEPFMVYLPHLSQSDLDEMLAMFRMKAERNQGNGHNKKMRRGA